MEIESIFLVSIRAFSILCLAVIVSLYIFVGGKLFRHPNQLFFYALLFEELASILGLIETIIEEM